MKQFVKITAIRRAEFRVGAPKVLDVDCELEPADLKPMQASIVSRRSEMTVRVAGPEAEALLAAFTGLEAHLTEVVNSD